MTKDRRDLEKKIISAGHPKCNLSHARVDGFNIVILKEDRYDISYETFFFLSDVSPFVEIFTTKGTKVEDPAEMLKKLNRLNLESVLMNFSLDEDRPCVRTWVEHNTEAIYASYMCGIDMLEQL